MVIFGFAPQTAQRIAGAAMLADGLRCVQWPRKYGDGWNRTLSNTVYRRRVEASLAVAPEKIPLVRAEPPAASFSTAAANLGLMPSLADNDP